MSTTQETRIRRKLDRLGRQLVKVRAASRWHAEFGPYYVVDQATNVILDRGIDDLAELEREADIEILDARRAELAGG